MSAPAHSRSDNHSASQPDAPHAGASARPGPASERVRLRRKRERGSHDRALIDAILDEALIAHLGIADERGQPFVIPTLHARHGHLVYVHGSSAGRTLRALDAGTPACLTVSLLDGLVLARAAMHHSANYRSVMLLGEARSVVEPTEKLIALEAIVEHIVPGRWAQARPPSENELKATSVLARAAMHHSANYRSVMLLGKARLVESSQEKLTALEAIVEHIVPGRWAEARAPAQNELKATSVLALPI
ncbi:MAG TPA: pyridoxamine 5'-phosphate oxidase family protein, partial [Solirubrobacteraceae bacterium]|nr:pyridoxamine 5'-phosphate oxidase family protein [Solirubrobacteraceae bacterium]